MSWGNLVDKLSDGGGLGALFGAVFTAACLAAVGIFKAKSVSDTSRDADLTKRELAYVAHQAEEIDRLSSLISNLDDALKKQCAFHRDDVERERQECNARMTVMQAEIELLKRRMSSEESR